MYTPLRHLLCIVSLLAVVGCSDTDIEQRRRHSLEIMDWGGGGAEDKRVQQLIVTALEQADETSLKSPQLVNVTMRVINDDSSRGALGVDWIATEPQADAIRVCLRDGTKHDMAFDDVEIAYNKQQAREHLVFCANPFAEREYPDVWKHLLDDDDATAVLISNGEPISNEQTIHRVEIRH